MSDTGNRALDHALKIQDELLHEIRHGAISRRAMHRKLLLGGGGALAALAQLRSGRALAASGSSNATSDSTDQVGATVPTEAFSESLVHVNRDPYVMRTTALESEPSQFPYGEKGECNRDPHQEAAWAYWTRASKEDRKTYLLKQQVVKAKLHAKLPDQDMWGFNGMVPGPTFHSRYGKPCIVRIDNQLPAISEHHGYGCPETTTHLHNGHTPSESDGYPNYYFPRQAELDPNEGDRNRWRDHLYPNIYAGGDPLEALGTLWYHDHRHNFTSHNVYRGLAGFHLMFDEVDSNDEGSTDSRALKLPSGEYDVPLMVTDRFFDAYGVSQFDQLNFDGIIGNKYVVNGKVQPRFEVEPRQYRLRILNPGVSRTYGFALYVSDSPNGLVNAKPLPALIIGTGGNLLPKPIPLRDPTPLGGSQRLDLIVDFAKVTGAGKKYVYLVNRFLQTNGRMPEGYKGSGPNGVMFDLMSPGDAIMRFDVVLARRDNSPPVTVDTKLRAMPWNPKGLDNNPDDKIGQLTEKQILDAVGKSNPFPGVARVRSWKFDRNNGQWSVNGKLFDGSVPDAQVGLNTGEIWIIEGAGSWVHPIHLHFEEHRTLYRSGVKPRSGDLEYGRDDTMLIGAGERGILYRKFRDFTGKYVMHCHNVVHEDHAMMVRWDIVA